MPQVAFALLVLLAAVGGLNAWTSRGDSSCFAREDCQTYPCNRTGAKNTSDVIAPLWLFEHGPGFTMYQRNMERAATIIHQYPGVHYSEPKEVLHTTLKYFCCYTKPELMTIADAIQQYKWKPFNVTFDRISCNKFPTNTDFLALLSPESSAAMQTWIHDLEAWVTQKTQLPIHKPRRLETPFHGTLASVNSSFPVDSVLARIHDEVPTLNTIPMTIKWFFMEDPFTIFRAGD